jgi:hypothetical protein
MTWLCPHCMDRLDRELPLGLDLGAPDTRCAAVACEVPRTSDPTPDPTPDPAGDPVVVELDSYRRRRP